MPQSNPTRGEEPVGTGEKYTPNHISLDTRAFYLVCSSLMLAYAVASLVRDDFFIWLPRRLGRDPVEIHLNGTAAWLAAGAVVCASANLLSVVVDHYDRRNNETNYRVFAKSAFRLAIALLVLAMLAQRFRYY